MNPLLRSMVPEQIAQIPQLAGLPDFRATQLINWVFGHGVFNWEEMGNLPLALRNTLSGKYDLRAL